MDQAASWSTANKMIPNVDKTKDMIIYFQKQPRNIPPVTIKGTDIKQISSVKLLGMIKDRLTWTDNITYVLKLPSDYTILISCEGLGLKVVTFLFSKSVIRPVIEYACPVWHASLTMAGSQPRLCPYRREP